MRNRIQEKKIRIRLELMFNLYIYIYISESSQKYTDNVSSVNMKILFVSQTIYITITIIEY